MKKDNFKIVAEIKDENENLRLKYICRQMNNHPSEKVLLHSHNSTRSENKIRLRFNKRNIWH